MGRQKEAFSRGIVPQFLLRMSLDVALYNSIFNILGKMSQWQDCLAGLQEMPLLRLRPNQISYVAAMTACSRGSHWAQACDLLKMMAAHTTPPNVISHNAALNALSSAKLWQRCLEMMESLEITWDSVSYCTTIGACGNAGNWQVVLLLLEQMRMPFLGRVADVWFWTREFCNYCDCYDILRYGMMVDVGVS